MENTSKLKTRKDTENIASMVSQEQVAKGDLLLVDPSGKEYPISDYTKELSPERERAILDKTVLLEMASSLHSADVRTIIRNFREKLANLSQKTSGKIPMDEYIKVLETELTFHKFIRDVNNEKDQPENNDHHPADLLEA